MVTRTVSVTLLLYPAWGLALSVCKQWRSSNYTSRKRTNYPIILFMITIDINWFVYWMYAWWLSRLQSTDMTINKNQVLSNVIVRVFLQRSLIASGLLIVRWIGRVAEMLYHRWLSWTTATCTECTIMSIKAIKALHFSQNLNNSIILKGCCVCISWEQKNLEMYGVTLKTRHINPFLSALEFLLQIPDLPWTSSDPETHQAVGFSKLSLDHHLF